MTDVLIVDWLGRGGISQTTQAFALALRRAGSSVVIASRHTDSLDSELSVRKRLPGVLGALDAHRRLAAAVSATVDEMRPSVVYLQNYWIPRIETPVASAARARGARVVLAIHNDVPHQLRAGTSIGLAQLVSAADDLVVHSDHVARKVNERFGRDASRIDLPLQRVLIDSTPRPMPELEGSGDRPIALTFGVLARRYKGVSALRDVAHGATNWTTVAAGVGAGNATGFEIKIDRFLDDAELSWLIRQARVALLPYRSATQSAAVVLAQALGAPPIVPAVGGVSEQVDHGVSGYLLSASPSTEDWRRALEEIEADERWWDAVATQARTIAIERGRAAEAGFVRLVGSAP